LQADGKDNDRKMEIQKARDDSDLEIAAGIGRGEQKSEKQYQYKNDPNELILCPSET
jgi:hypothetical protein